MASDSTKPITNYIFELGVLKKFKHCGTKFAGVKDPDTIAEHAFRTAQIGYILAKMEKHKHPEKVALMCLFHDNGEARIGDHHKIAANYLDHKKGEEQAFYAQVKPLPKNIGPDIWEFFREFEHEDSHEAHIAKDADYLETAFQAKEYKDLGYAACQNWLNNVEKVLKTPSAKKLFNSMKRTQFTDWWQGLK